MYNFVTKLKLNIFSIIDYTMTSIQSLFDETEIGEDEISSLSNKIDEIMPMPKEITVPAPKFNPATNILELSGRLKYEKETLFTDNKIFGPIIPTTTTMEGYLTHVQFHESNLIRLLRTTDKIVNIRCNWEDLKHPNYKEYKKLKLSNRGRKKKPKVESKKYSNTADFSHFDEFHSQITFNVLPKWVNVSQSSESIVIPNYKYKIFRNGKIQLPGAHPKHTDDILYCIDEIIKLLNETMHQSQNVITVTNLNPVMKNYKFTVNIPDNYILDLLVLKKLLMSDKINNLPNKFINKTNIMQPMLHIIQYSRQTTKLSIKFLTPLLKRGNKQTLVNIFPSGKINILGALDFIYTDDICRYLHHVFANNYNSIVVEKGIPDEKKIIPAINKNSINLINNIKVVNIYDIIKSCEERFDDSIVKILNHNTLTNDLDDLDDLDDINDLDNIYDIDDLDDLDDLDNDLADELE